MLGQAKGARQDFRLVARGARLEVGCLRLGARGSRLEVGKEHGWAREE